MLGIKSIYISKKGQRSYSDIATIRQAPQGPILQQTECVGNVAFEHIHDVIKWKHLPRYWPFVRGIHRSPVNSPHKDQWRGALMFSLICVWISGWVNNREAGDLRRYRAHHDVTVMPSNHVDVLHIAFTESNQWSSVIQGTIIYDTAIITFDRGKVSRVDSLFSCTT